MNQFDIYTDSSANLPHALIKKYDIGVISYVCTVNGQERYCYENNVAFSETAKSFYHDMQEGADIKTSLIGCERILDAVSPSMKNGKDAIMITISSGISGTYQQALEAKKILEEQYPDRKFYVCDSANASFGEGLLALKIADLRSMGASAKTCYEWLMQNAYCYNSYFTVSDLKYLRKGGRISTTLAIAGTLLNIKPVLKASGELPAKISFHSKERGRKKSILALVKAFEENAISPENNTVAIAHADCEEDALALAQILRERGVHDIIIEYYDLCSGTHVGPGTLALFFYGKDRRVNIPSPVLSVVGTPVSQKI